MSKDEAVAAWKKAARNLAFAHGAVSSDDHSREEWLEELAVCAREARKKALEFHDV